MMKLNKFSIAMLAMGIALLALTSCQKEQPPQTPAATLPPSGEIKNFKIITGCSASRMPNFRSSKGSIFYLYSDVFPFLLLDGFTVTIQALNDPNSLMFYHPDGDSVSHSVTIPKKVVIEVDKIIEGPGYLHTCDKENGSYMGICYKLPKSDCVIPFFLDIENLKLSLKYRTPIYYYMMSSDPNMSDRTFDSIL